MAIHRWKPSIPRAHAGMAFLLLLAAAAARWAAAADFVQPPGLYNGPVPQQGPWPVAMDAPQQQAAPYSVAYADQVPPPGPVQPMPAAGTAQLSTSAAPVAEGEKKEQEKTDAEKTDGEKKDDSEPKNFTIHAQTTVVAQGDPAFAAKYSGPNSLNMAGERQETLNADLFVGMRLWQGAEFHVDALNVGRLRPEPDIRHRGFS